MTKQSHSIFALDSHNFNEFLLYPVELDMNLALIIPIDLIEMK